MEQSKHILLSHPFSFVRASVFSLQAGLRLYNREVRMIPLASRPIQKFLLETTAYDTSTLQDTLRCELGVQHLFSRWLGENSSSATASYSLASIRGECLRQLGRYLETSARLYPHER